jgi:twinkle protein
MKTYHDYGIEIPSGRTKGNVKVFCPQCHKSRSDKHDKSLSVDLDKGVWNCHYCGFSGHLEYTEEERKEWAKQQMWYNPHQSVKHEPKTYRKPKPRQHSVMSDKAYQWFAGRGISKQTVDAMRITEGMEFMPQKNKEQNTVQFNYYKNGELVNTKFRTGDKLFKLCQGAELLPYNIDAIKGQKECIITEGEMDALSFYECGRHDVVSVPNGANANLTYLDDYIADYFDDKETIFIASDSDTKGVLLRDELIRRFGAERCRIVEYGDGCKDANEHLQKFGKESLLKCLADAPEIKIEGIFAVSDFEQSLDAIFETGLKKGVTIGHENFDRLCSFETKRLLVVTGIPGSGKSEFIDEMAERLNMRYGWRFAYFSPENAPLAYHASKLIEKFTGKKFGKQTLPLGEYVQVKQHLESDFFFISPRDDFRVDSILDRAKFLVRRRGIKALVIDPYNRLENEQGSKNETQYISGLLDRLTKFAQQNDVLVILMAHPTKQPRNRDGVIEPPTLYDISGSAHFYNKCDFGIIVHRDRIQEKVEVRVSKVKFRHLGEVGKCYFKYNLNNGRYTPLIENKEPLWDNSNHLITDLQQKEMAADAASVLNFGEDETYSEQYDNSYEEDEECPF